MLSSNITPWTISESEYTYFRAYIPWHQPRTNKHDLNGQLPKPTLVGTSNLLTYTYLRISVVAASYFTSFFATQVLATGLLRFTSSTPESHHPHLLTLFQHSAVMGCSPSCTDQPHFCVPLFHHCLFLRKHTSLLKL